MLRLTVIVCLLGTAFAQLEIKDRMINADTAQITDCPHLVSIQNRGAHFCGGIIMDKYYVLTAAHCLMTFKDKKLDKLTVRAGSSKPNIGGQVNNIIDFKLHPKYNASSKVADVALARLGSPLQPHTGVKVVRMDDGVPTDGDVGLICGFGVLDQEGYLTPNVLQVAKVNILSRKSCTKQKDYGDMLSPSMFCAQGDGIDACQGDSGGPLTRLSTGTLLGITSWGIGCGEANYPGVYVRVNAYKNWIKANIANF